MNTKLITVVVAVYKPWLVVAGAVIFSQTRLTEMFRLNLNYTNSKMFGFI